MGRFERGWALLRSSWSVLREDPKLILFPCITMAALTLIMATFALPFLVDHDLFESLSNRHYAGGGHGRLLAYVLTFLFYLATNFVIVFFNTALIACVMMRFRGERPTLSAGLGVAMSRLPQIAAWAAVAATVGMLLKMLEERVPFLGKIAIRLVGMAWAVVTYFVAPVLVVEGLGPMRALKRSAELLKRTWGESLVGQASMGLIGFLAVLPGIALIVMGVSLARGGSPVPMILGFGLGFLWFVAIAIISSAVQQIFVAGTYLYASEGRLPSGFDPDVVQAAFRVKH